jgi:hypothetical protein
VLRVKNSRTPGLQHQRFFYIVCWAGVGNSEFWKCPWESSSCLLRELHFQSFLCSVLLFYFHYSSLWFIGYCSSFLVFIIMFLRGKKKYKTTKMQTMKL